MSNNKKWWIVIVYTLLIFASIPTIRRAWEFVGSRNGYIFVVASFIGIITFIYVNTKKISLIILLIIASIFIFKFVKLPIERIHFVEYGILGWLAHRAGGKKAFIYVIIISILDELIQKITPNRYFGMKDIYMNIIGGGFGIFLREYAR